MIDESKITELYVKQGLSGRDISKKTGYALTTIQRVLKKHNVVRGLKEARVNLFQKGYKHPFKKELDKKEIIHLYVEKNVSSPNIAKIFNCSLAPILRVFRENNIPTKNPRESHLGKPSYWKGKKRPDISVAMKGRKFSEKHKENLRKSHLGKKPAFTGKTYDEFYGEKAKELKEKLRISHLGQVSTQKGKSYEEIHGKDKSGEIKNKLSEITKDRFSDKIVRLEQSIKIKKYIEEHPEWKELKKKQTTEYFIKYPEIKEAHSKRMKKYYSKAENKEGMIKRMKEYYISHPEVLKKMSEVSKKIWSTPEKREYARKRRLKQHFPFKHTLPEKLVFDEMELRGIKFEKHKTVLNYCQPDAVIDGMRLAIFVDGDYWHAHPEKYKDKQLNKVQIDKIRRDKEQNELLQRENWVILRFWESDIKKDVTKCVSQIEEVIRLNRVKE